MNRVPLFFNLQNRKILVIGGGRIALRKARALSFSKAVLTIISPAFLPEFSLINNAQLIKRPVSKTDITKQFNFVIITTNDSVLNTSLAERCKELNILFNRTDNADESDFFIPLTIDKNPVTIAISSSGVPQMSKFISERILESLTENVWQLAQVLAEIRPLLKEKLPEENSRKTFLSGLISKTWLKNHENTSPEELKKEILKCL
jgi:uroporphyrin-III C-methyltransferase/precorrin-2 dehydrogenase/sirohydrochlorin ferrochelatase